MISFFKKMADIVAHTIFIPFAHRFPDFLRQREASLWSLSATCLSMMLRQAKHRSARVLWYKQRLPVSLYSTGAFSPVS